MPQQTHALRAAANSQRLTFWLLVLLSLIVHGLVFFLVNVRYTDSDQAFMWAGVSDYASGVFMEPRFYGQDYNTFVEAVVALPFYLAGLPVYYSLPLATHVCSLLAFMIPAFYLYRRGWLVRASLFLAVPLCLPLAFDVMTGIPRGFVPGLLFTCFFVHSLHDPHNLRLLTLNSAMSVIGFFVNPNTLLLSAPVLFYLFLKNFRDPRYYLASSVILPVAAACYLLFDLFYDRHPEYVVYSVNLEFSTEHLFGNLAHLHSRIAHVSFFSETHGWFTFVAYLILLVSLWIFNRAAFWASLAVPLVMVVALSSNKGGDGSMWPFYSFGRNYLALPLFFALFISLLKPRNRLSYAFISAALAFTIFKLATVNRTVATYLDEKNWLGVHLVKMEDALNVMGFYREVCRQHGTEQLMVSNLFWLNTVLSYGGGAVHDDFPVTFETHYERRYWMRKGRDSLVVPVFVYVSPWSDLVQRLQPDGFRIRKLDDYGLHLVWDNTLTNGEFIKLVWATENR